MDVSGGFSSIPRSDLKIGGNELDKNANERSNNKTELLSSSSSKLDLKTDDVNCVKGVSSASTCLNDDLSSSVCTKPGSSECGSSSVPPVEGNNDPMKLWKAMKQNGFLSNPHGGVSVTTSSSCVVSSSHGGIPAPPKKRGRRSKSGDAAAMVKKRKVEIARKEEADRFARLAAPSGLLNELNPGIINHVRNKRQVLSIIRSIVKSDRDSMRDSNATTVGGSRKNLEDGYRSDFNNTHEEKWAGGECSEDNNTSGKYSENASSLSSEDAAGLNHASVLTVKAATVASQWLELLRQDIKCRVSALRRSKKRVRAVVTTELPFLIMKEFPADQENDPNGASRSSTVDNHKNRWMALFNQLEQTLSEEEKQLENWLNQVRELQSHCDRGLHNLSLSSGQNFLQLGMPFSSRAADALLSDKDFVVRAAAASIYSTCNFLASKENIAFT
ncbi:Cation-transporting ATPase [Hirschfeldia incana]|nr:Cation-transporting ATPase [Hirschfeldia incana]